MLVHTIITLPPAFVVEIAEPFAHLVGHVPVVPFTPDVLGVHASVVVPVLVKKTCGSSPVEPFELWPENTEVSNKKEVFPLQTSFLPLFYEKSSER